MFARAGADDKKSSVREALLPSGGRDSQDHRDDVAVDGEGGEKHAQARGNASGSAALERTMDAHGQLQQSACDQAAFWHYDRSAVAEAMQPLRIELDQWKQGEEQYTEQEALATLRQKISEATRKQRPIQTSGVGLSCGGSRQASLDGIGGLARKDAKSRLKELGREHAQRDANTMLW